MKFTRAERNPRWRAGLGILAAISGAACSEPEEGELKTISESQPLYYVTTKIWNQRDITVCWTTAGQATEKAWVEEAMRGQRSWAQQANINFVGWGACGAGGADIEVTGGNSMATGYLSLPAGSSAAVELDFTANVANNYSRCTVNGLTREQCIKTAGIHEFGHAIGFAHEHNRPDTPASCTSNPQGTNGNATYGDWDGLSIMAYCDFLPELSGTDRAGTERLYGARSGDDTHLADYNGDGSDDLFCFDVMNGDMWADYASAGQYSGTNWSRASGWCDGTDHRRIFTGDFNGDGHDDLLCFDTNSGSEFIDYANGSGEFLAENWSLAANWCDATDTRQLHIGDFNGDGRDDLLCFDSASGDEFIDYADASGHFAGTDWTGPGGWCDATATRRVYVGDFNGDGRDDLYCHDIGNGDQYVDYASATGTFTGTNWSRAGGWCNHVGAQIYIGDYNGDGSEDLLCFDVTDGRKWVDYASAGQFSGTNWSNNIGWCDSSGSRMFVGDANGDGRDDLVCHNVRSGSKWVDYASATGQFAGTDWSLASGWCNHDSGEVH